PLPQVPPEAGHVLSDVVGGLLERDEDAVLSSGDTRGQELHREHRLSAPGGAGDQRRPVVRQPSLGNDVEARDPGLEFLDRTVVGDIVRRRHFFLGRVGAVLGATSSPSSTLSLSDMSPITRRRGGGSRLINVGVASTRSTSAASGSSSTSTISSEYCPLSSWSQMRRRLEIAASARGFVPVMNSLRVYLGRISLLLTGKVRRRRL